MTALAQVLVNAGISVTGSDTNETFFTDRVLKKLGITVSEGFAPENIPARCDAVIYSTAYSPERNPELRAALAEKVSVWSYPEALGFLTREKLTLAVCGTHGKTTTSALLATLLAAADLDPLAVVGSEITGWGGNALPGKGNYFVLEADEYQNKLALYEPHGVILTSIDWDHPDFFPTPADYTEVFHAFVKRIPQHGFLVACGDSAAVKAVASVAHTTVSTYGFLPDNAAVIHDFTPLLPDTPAGERGMRSRFSIIWEGRKLGPFELRLAGQHNALNATAVLLVGLRLKIPLPTLTQALADFRGTKRRFEFIGERKGALIFDDYAHHPDEVRATLAAVRGLYPERQIHAIFHPHTFTRTKALLQDFAQCFEDADEVYVLDIYGSARESQGGVNADELVTLMNRYRPGLARYAANRAELTDEMRGRLNRHDLVLTLGAGDVWQVAEALVSERKGK